MTSSTATLSAQHDTIRFVLDGDVVTLRAIDPTRTVLNYLREDLGRIGTKEGCAEGDCGACTVVIGEPAGERLRWRAVNACIQFVPTLDGKALFTVESLKAADGTLHPVQRAMVEQHGSQCGFCTPGFVMSLFALYKSEPRPDRSRIDDALAGNLCRCTGYRPIIDAARQMHGLAGADWLGQSFDVDAAPGAEERALVSCLSSLRRTDLLALEHTGRRYFAPASIAGLGSVLEQYPAACVLAGGTDVGLWVTKQHCDLATVVYLGNVAGLQTIETSTTHIEIGAGVSLTDALPPLAAAWPDLGELLRRFASPPIRNVATLVGNIANGSPIGDIMPALLALGASVVLRNGVTPREVPLDRFYLDYQVKDLAPGEFVERVRIPLPVGDCAFRAYKISKRFDQDIAAVCGAFSLWLEDEQVSQIRLGFGGLAAIPKRAVHAEQALTGKPWNAASVEVAAVALARDFTPLTDLRASSAYRQQVAANLLRKFHLETTSQSVATRVLAYGR